VKHVGYVSDAELRALYEHAHGFVHPSYYEGFGLPPLEAMACGCPVLVSNTASMPEVCGNAALYFDAHDSADLADKVRQLMQDEALRQRLRQSGLERAEHFAWRKCAEKVSQRIDTIS
jgi:glycosyltransferase involved in cell wall biosynthesis